MLFVTTRLAEEIPDLGGVDIVARIVPRPDL